jgi:hypothetical protein
MSVLSLDVGVEIDVSLRAVGTSFAYGQGMEAVGNTAREAKRASKTSAIDRDEMGTG